MIKILINFSFVLEIRPHFSWNDFDVDVDDDDEDDDDDCDNENLGLK